MIKQLEEHSVRSRKSRAATPRLCKRKIVRVKRSGDDEGLQKLKDTLASVVDGTFVSGSCLSQFGAVVPRHGEVEKTLKKFKEERVISLDQLLDELGLAEDGSVVNYLRVLNNSGSILYFGNGGDDLLSKYIVLSPDWLVDSMTCVLSQDTVSELTSLRDNYGTKTHVAIRQLFGDQSCHNCPLLSADNAKMLWKSFGAALGNMTNAVPDLHRFLEHLLVGYGVFLPLDYDSKCRSKLSDVFFVPSLPAA